MIAPEHRSLSSPRDTLFILYNARKLVTPCYSEQCQYWHGHCLKLAPLTGRGAAVMTIEQLGSNHVKNSVVMHIDELLDMQNRQNIESIVEQVGGVSRAHFNVTRHHLMVVNYDPKRTNSGTILTRVKRQHLHAQLI